MIVVEVLITSVFAICYVALFSSLGVKHERFRPSGGGSGGVTQLLTYGHIVNQ